MHLFEEYRNRHNLQFPVIKRPNKEIYLLANVINSKQYALINDCNNLIFSFNMVMAQAQPPHFEMNIYAPRHNAGVSMEQIQPSSKCEWEEYEEWISKIVKKWNFIVPVDVVGAKVIMWEMFIYMNDLLLSKNDLQQHIILPTLDTQSDTSSRLKAIDQCVSFLHGSTLHAMWSRLAKFCDSENYATWLADMFQPNLG